MPPQMASRGLINRYSNIEQHKERIANELRLRGFLGVMNYPNTPVLYATIENYLVAIFHYRFDQFQFLELVVVTGENYNKAEEILNRVWRAISQASQP